jgi:uncharacterized protein YndB with AHSA1/START domain
MVASESEARAMQDREIVITRILNAPHELVFKVWTDPDHLIHWWGPEGFTNTFHEIDVRPGGVWRFVMHGPDGVDYDNKVEFIEVVEPERLVYRHGDDTGESEPFHVTVTFADDGGKTRLTLRMLFGSAAERDRSIGFGAVEGGNSTLDRLAAYLVSM